MTLETSLRSDETIRDVCVPPCADIDATRLGGRKQVRIEAKYARGVRDVEIRYAWIGAADGPTVIVQGGISGNRHVTAAHPASVNSYSVNADSAGGWWDAQVGVGKAIDLVRWRVLAIDWLTADDVGASSVSSEDQADALAALMNSLRIERVHAFIGASYGAMVGLAFAARHAHRLDRLVAIAGANRPHPFATAQRAVQRGILRLGIDSGNTQQAVSLARQLGMITYRGHAEFARRFAGGAELHDSRFRLPVESWLEHAGNRFAQHFDAHRYLSLSESIDLHDVDPTHVRVPTTLIGFSSDRLVPLADLCTLQRNLGVAAHLEVIQSDNGHDGFLTEHAKLAPVLREALDATGGCR